MLLSIFTSENIGYTSAVISALLAIVVALVFLFNKQDDGRRKLRPVAVIIVVLALVAGGISVTGMYLNGQLQRNLTYGQETGMDAMNGYQLPAADNNNEGVNIDTAKATGGPAYNQLPAKSYGPVTGTISNKPVYVDTVKVMPGYY